MFKKPSCLTGRLHLLCFSIILPLAAPCADNAATLQRLTAKTAHIRSLSEPEVLELIPKQSRGIAWTTCPSCRKRSRTALWEWSPTRPHEVICSDCKTVYPNDRYPENQAIRIEAPEGEHVFRYHEEAPGGIRRFFTETARYHSKKYVAEQARLLGNLFALSRDEAHAARVLSILQEFARVYPGYPAVVDGEWINKPVSFIPYTTREISGYKAAQSSPVIGAVKERAARWEYWAYMDISQELLEAFDCIKDSRSMQSPEGRTAVAKIRSDLFGGQIRYVLSFQDTLESNMAITAKWPSLIKAARILDDSKLYHAVTRSINAFAQQCFLHDGSWWETSPSYMLQICEAGLKHLPEAANGYSDTPGYIDPVDGTHVQKADLSQLPAFKKASWVVQQSCFPNGHLLPVNDTWPSARVRDRGNVISQLLPGFGVATLAQGAKDSDLFAYLNFSSGVSHKHSDALSLGLFCHGEELFSDIGYTHSRYKPWAISTMSHNTVVVNGVESRPDPQHTGNRLRFHAAGGQTIQISSAESRSAYPGITDRYRRTLAMIGGTGETAYVVDLFEVHGGSQHDYLLHSCRDKSTTASLAGADLEEHPGDLLNPGVAFKLPDHERDMAHPPGSSYGFIKNLQRADAKGEALVLEFDVKGDPKTGSRSTLLTSPKDQIFIGDAPSIRGIGGAHMKEDESKLDQARSPVMVWRKKGDKLRSHFIAVHEALPNQTSIRSIQQLATNDDGLVLRIDRGPPGIDYFICALNDSARIEALSAEGPIQFKGRHGFIRVESDGKAQMEMWGEGYLNFRNERVENASGTVSGHVLVAGNEDHAEGGFLDVAETLPESKRWSALVLTFPDSSQRAYNLTKISRRPDHLGSRLDVRETPGFRVVEHRIDFLSYPQRHLPSGAITYQIHSAASAASN